MKWILCGKNDAAVAALEHLQRRGDEVWAVATPSDDGDDGWQRSFAGAAHRCGVKLDQPERLNDPEFVEQLAAFGARALISIQYDQILGANLFETLPVPCLNFHFALLPRHRGVSPIAWAIALGDRESGVTLHHMVVGIDAGDVLAQRAVPIAPGGTARDLYDVTTTACIELFRETVPFSDELLERRLIQDETTACYHRTGDFDFARRRIDWRRDAGELHAWIRAMIFPPHQFPEFVTDSGTFRVLRIAPEIAPVANSAAPGSVTQSSDVGLEVACAGGAVRITEIADTDGRRIDLSTLSRALAAGKRLPIAEEP